MMSNTKDLSHGGESNRANVDSYYVSGYASMRITVYYLYPAYPISGPIMGWGVKDEPETNMSKGWKICGVVP